MPVWQAILRNALPTAASSILFLVYNLADTFFIGLTHDDLQVAAVSLAMPVFLAFMAFGTVFGVGGVSVVSRALGAGRMGYVKGVSAFCLWGGIASSVLATVALYVFMDPFLVALGANADMFGHTRDYMLIVAASGPLGPIAGVLSNLLRAEGRPGPAMVGNMAGNVINIVLDPILILGLGWGIRGAAVATVAGSLAGAAYYLWCFRRGRSILSLDPRRIVVRDRVASGVLAIGLPAALGPLLMSVSSIVVNAWLATYGSLAVAAAGVAGKVSMIIGSLAMGLGQGVQPLLGYSVGARNWGRYRAYIRTSVVICLVVCGVMTGLCYAVARPLIGVFLAEPESLRMGVAFAYIFQTTASLFGVYFVYANALQAMGAATVALIVNVSRQGLIYLPALVLLHHLFGLYGLIWAQPAADVLALAMAVVCHNWALRRLVNPRA
jgi:putative MATE family efflux protein